MLTSLWIRGKGWRRVRDRAESLWGNSLIYNFFIQLFFQQNSLPIPDNNTLIVGESLNIPDETPIALPAYELADVNVDESKLGLRWDKLLYIPISLAYENELIRDEILWERENSDVGMIKHFSVIWLQEKFHELLKEKSKTRYGKSSASRSRLFANPKSSRYDRLDIAYENPLEFPVSAETIESKCIANCSAVVRHD